MEKKDYLYTALGPVEPSPALYLAIIKALREVERRGARLRFALFSVMSLLLGMALVPVVEYAAQQFSASGFYSYLSLALSDNAVFTAFWRELLFSLVESLPALALLLLIPLAAAFIWAVSRGARNARVAFT